MEKGRRKVLYNVKEENVDAWGMCYVRKLNYNLL